MYRISFSILCVTLRSANAVLYVPTIFDGYYVLFGDIHVGRRCHTVVGDVAHRYLSNDSSRNDVVSVIWQIPQTNM